MIPDRDQFLDANHFRDITGAPQPIDYPPDVVSLGVHFASFEAPQSADFQIYALLATGRPVPWVLRRIGEAIQVAVDRGDDIGVVRAAQARLHAIATEYQDRYVPTVLHATPGPAPESEPASGSDDEPVRVGDELRAIRRVLLEIRDRLAPGVAP